MASNMARGPRLGGRRRSFAWQRQFARYASFAGICLLLMLIAIPAGQWGIALILLVVLCWPGWNLYQLWRAK